MLIDIQEDGRPVGYLTVPEFADYYGVTIQSVYAWIRDGKISALTIGKALYIHEDTKYPKDKKRGRKRTSQAVEEDSVHGKQ